MTTTRGLFAGGDVLDLWLTLSLLTLAFDPISAKALLALVTGGSGGLSRLLERAVVRGWMKIKAVQQNKKTTRAARCVVL